MSPASGPRGRRRLLGRAALAMLVLLGMLAVAGYRYYAGGVPSYTLPASPAQRPERPPREPATGPLRRHPENPRYFTDGSGKAILLTGAHTWSNLQDNGPGDPPKPFDYDAYLDFLVAHNHNFFRLWGWEQARWGPWAASDNYFFHPGPPYQRPGPGTALDGKPRFDLDRFEPAYFDRVRTRVARAAARGIYVAVMLFNGWAIDNAHSRLYRGNPWRGHPFNRDNNVNGVDGDPNRNGGGEETHELAIPRVTSYQEAYVRRMIDAVNEFDNVLFEISNESYAPSRDWQYHIIEFIHRYEATKPKRHPVGMSQYQWPGNNADLMNGPADWVSPWEELPTQAYRDDPPIADGRKVVIVDTDHIWGIGGDRGWAWKTFLRGNQPSFMDGYDGASVGCGAPAPWDVRVARWKDIAKDLLRLAPRPSAWEPNDAQWVSLRANMGYIRDFAQRVPLAQMTPQPALASSRFCLARATPAAADYLVYVESSATPVTMDLSGYQGRLREEWFDPRTGALTVRAEVAAGGLRTFTSPFTGDAVLYLSSTGVRPAPASHGVRQLAALEPAR